MGLGIHPLKRWAMTFLGDLTFNFYLMDEEKPLDLYLRDLGHT